MATILVDHPHREIPGLLMVEKKTKDISSFYFDHQDLYYPVSDDFDSLFKRFSKDRDFILTPSFNVKRTPNIALRSKINRLPLIVYHSEQFYNKCFNDEKLNLSFLDDYLKDVHYHLVWGEYYKNKLLEIGVDANKIYVVGSVKDELAQFKRASASIAQRKKKFDFLFIANFVLADYSKEKLEHFRKEFSVGSEWEPGDYFSSSREGMLDLVSRISREYPEKKILIRRHPGENKSIYESFALEHSNVSLSQDNALIEDVEHSEYSILQDSTSIFELESYGANWISVQFGNGDSEYTGEPKELFDLHTQDDFMARLSLGELHKISGSSVLRDKGADFYVDSNHCAEKVASALLEITSKKHRFNYNMRFLKDLSLMLLKFFSSQFAVFLNRIGFNNYIYNRLKSSENTWKQGDHIINKINMEHFREITKD